MKIVCFDVETPNRRNDRMSSIGIAVVENRVITDEFYSLVNPEEPFDDFNIALTHITPEMASEAPTFAELWKKIGNIMKSGLLCAHNAQFDMSVLSKCLRSYSIPLASSKYICTCRMGKRLLPYIENHKLDTVCRDLMIPLDHHNALSDAKACAEILIHMLSKGADIGEFIRPYDLKHAKTLK